MGEMAELLLGSQDDMDFYEESFMNGYGNFERDRKREDDEDD